MPIWLRNGDSAFSVLGTCRPFSESGHRGGCVRLRLTDGLCRRCGAQLFSLHLLELLDQRDDRDYDDQQCAPQYLDDIFVHSADGLILITFYGVYALYLADFVHDCMQALRILDIKADRALENVVVRLDIDLPDIDAEVLADRFARSSSMPVRSMPRSSMVDRYDMALCCDHLISSLRILRPN